MTGLNKRTGTLRSQNVVHYFAPLCCCKTNNFPTLSLIIIPYSRAQCLVQLFCAKLCEERIGILLQPPRMKDPARTLSRLVVKADTCISYRGDYRRFEFDMNLRSRTFEGSQVSKVHQKRDIRGFVNPSRLHANHWSSERA